jgi:hypothetical protein
MHGFELEVLGGDIHIDYNNTQTPALAQVCALFHNLSFMEHWRGHVIVTNNDAGFRHRHIWRNQLPPLGRRQQRAQSRLIVLRNTSGNCLPARGHEPSPINPEIQSMKRAAVSIAAATRSAETSEPGPSS